MSHSSRRHTRTHTCMTSFIFRMSGFDGWTVSVYVRAHGACLVENKVTFLEVRTVRLGLGLGHQGQRSEGGRELDHVLILAVIT